MTMPMRKQPVLLALAASLAGAMPAGAATVSRDALSRMMLDSCIYRQHAVKDVDRASLVDDCRCAVTAAMTRIEGERFELPRSGGLTGPQDQAVREGIAACFGR